MIYWLLQQFSDFDFPGRNLMGYITFRAGVSFALALLVALVFGHAIIRRLRMMQIGEDVRNLGLEGQVQKKGTPTMGGIIIILSTLVPCLLMGNLGNIYLILMIVATLWMGSIGFLDDYRKFKFHNKDGLSEETRTKILEAVKAMGYEVNFAASALKRNPIRVAYIGEAARSAGEYHACMLEGVHTAFDEFAGLNCSCDDLVVPYGHGAAAAECKVLDKNLHGDNEFGFAEFANKREKITEAIKLSVRNDFINVEHTDQGFLYSINDRGREVVQNIQSSYSKAYTVGAKIVCRKFSGFTDDGVLQYISDRATESKEA